MQHNSEDIVVGGVARIMVSITNGSNIFADPGALRLKLKSPVDGVVVTHTYQVGNTIVKDAVGQYHADIVMTAAGRWAYRWESDAPNAGADEGWVIVKKSTVV